MFEILIGVGVFFVGLLFWRVVYVYRHGAPKKRVLTEAEAAAKAEAAARRKKFRNNDILHDPRYSYLQFNDFYDR